MYFLTMLITCQLALLLSGLGHRGEVLGRRRGKPLVLRPLELLQQRRRLAQHLLRRRLLNRRSRVWLLFGLLRLKVYYIITITRARQKGLRTAHFGDTVLPVREKNRQKITNLAIF